MILPKFDHSVAKWDHFRAFHISYPDASWSNHGHIVQFDTGELIITRCMFRPHERILHNNFNLRIVSTRDAHCPALYESPEGGNALPLTYLNQERSQTLLIDTDRKEAVRLKYHVSERVPVRLRPYAYAYFAGVGEPAIGAPITLSEPKTYTKEEAQHVREIVYACKAWATLTETKPIPKNEWIPRGSIPTEDRDIAHRYASHGYDYIKLHKYPMSLLVATTFADMTDFTRTWVASLGVSMGRENREVERPYVR